jgi:flagellar biosynthesis protein FliR
LTLEQYLPANLFAFLLVFARIGAAFMLLPGFGESYVQPRMRLLLALILSSLLTPVLAPILPSLPASPMGLVTVFGSELVIGLYIGTVTRILLSALETTGTMVSLQLGLSNALIFDPAEAAQGSIPSSLYGMLGVVLIFVTNLHHLLLRALVDSYTLFTPGVLPPVGDFSEAIARAVAGSFRLAVEMASPFIVLGTMFFVCLGIIGRMVPQLQVLFVIQPLQIMAGLVIFAFVLVAGMERFLEVFVQQLSLVMPG